MSKKKSTVEDEKKAGRANSASAKKRARPKLKKNDSKPDRWKAWSWWLGKRLAIVVIILCLIPIVLSLIYKPSFVHPISSLMISKWFAGENVTRKWVPLEKISPHLWRSVMSSEDGQFCRHNGVDWTQIGIVIDDAIDGDKIRGASTITMQSVKNMFLWSSRSYIRKVLEVPLALIVDFIWGKRRTMEIYLNVAEWGPGIYGIEAASRHHFKRSAARLSRKQAALLAVTLPNPKLRNPRRPNRAMRRLARLVQKRARASGAYIKCLR